MGDRTSVARVRELIAPYADPSGSLLHVVALLMSETSQETVRHMQADLDEVRAEAELRGAVRALREAAKEWREGEQFMQRTKFFADALDYRAERIEAEAEGGGA